MPGVTIGYAQISLVLEAGDEALLNSSERRRELRTPEDSETRRPRLHPLWRDSCYRWRAGVTPLALD